MRVIKQIVKFVPSLILFGLAIFGGGVLGAVVGGILGGGLGVKVGAAIGGATGFALILPVHTKVMEKIDIWFDKRAIANQEAN